MTTQKQKVLNHLQEQGGLTQSQAKELYGIGCLSAYISNLKSQGCPIKKRVVGNGGETEYYMNVSPPDSDKAEAEQLINGLYDATRFLFESQVPSDAKLVIKRSDLSCQDMRSSAYDAKQTGQMEHFRRLELHIEIEWGHTLTPTEGHQ